MSGQLFSPSWHRVASLVPKLRKHTQIHRHHYRGELWYVLQDHLSTRVHRFTPAAYYIIGLMDGSKTVQNLWDLANQKLGDESPTQDEMIQLLSQLHSADVLQCNVTPDTSELFTRYQQIKKKTIFSRFLNPLSIRIPIFDPEKFLSKFSPVLNKIPGWLFATVWLVVVGFGLVQAGIHWQALTNNLADQVLTPHNLFIIWLLFPVIKALHEFGHAFAVKKWGGEVHEMGIMFLVLMPIPYVDASSASSFREKKKRIIVGAAGMIVEVFIAAIAMFIWLSVEEGLIHAIAYNTMLIAGVSTILFNANPLLRFDGYYILADILEIPNLSSRAPKYIGYLCQKYLFGVKNAQQPNATEGEKFWFLFHGIGSYIYRMFIVAIIVLFISAKFFVIGIILAVWSAIMMVVVPAVKAFSKIFTLPQIRPQRGRALSITFGVIASIVGLFMFVPVHSWTSAEGIIWVEGNSIVRAQTDCFINRLLVKPGSRVNAGEKLIDCKNQELLIQRQVLQSRIEELRAVYTMQLQNDLVKAEITNKEIESSQAELQRLDDEAKNLLITSKSQGIFVVPNPDDMIDRFVRKGELLGYTFDPENVTVKVVVPQNSIDLINQQTRHVELRRWENIDEIIPANITRKAPAATKELPSPALTTEGGGKVPIDPSSKEKILAFEKVFLIDLDLPDQTVSNFVGSRVYIKFTHDQKPIGGQLIRSLKQIFLGHFDV